LLIVPNAEQYLNVFSFRSNSLSDLYIFFISAIISYLFKSRALITHRALVVGSNNNNNNNNHHQHHTFFYTVNINQLFRIIVHIFLIHAFCLVVLYFSNKMHERQKNKVILRRGPIGWARKDLVEAEVTVSENGTDTYKLKFAQLMDVVG